MQLGVIGSTRSASKPSPPAPSEPRDIPSKRPSRYGRWRAATLAGVYILFALHIAHWKIAGKTLAPLELNEVMYTLELGIVTAGFLFMVAAFLSAAIFGRFFCSWGCHILALEDLCAWLLGKVGIRPKPVRSRMLLLVPPGALFYMFIWPQIARILRGDPMPQIRILSDAEGWASFVTTDFWRNLPGPGIAVVTFLICGFAIIYVLGSRSFCLYGCPYGVVFALADRIAPGRIIAKGSCEQCGHCTAVCQSHVRIHEEIAKYGMVVDPACLKDLDCVSACPNQVLAYGFTRPSLLRSFSRVGRRRLPYDFTLSEDVLMAVVWVATLLIFRGLYDLVPFLMTLGLGGIFAYLAVLTLRLATRPHVRLNQFQLKRSNRITTSGISFAVLMTVLGAFVIHSAFIRYHEFQGGRGFDRIAWYLDHKGTNPPMTLVAASLGHFRSCERWGLFKSPRLDHRLASLYSFSNPPTPAEPYYRRILARDARDYESRLQLARVLARCGRIEEARRELSIVASATGADEDQVKITHVRAEAHRVLAGIALTTGDRALAVTEYRAALVERPDAAGIHLALSEVFASGGDLKQAAAQLRTALEIDPSSAPAHYNLGVMLAVMGHEGEAIEQYREAIRLDPRDPESHNNLGFLLAKRGEHAAAREAFQRAINLRPTYAEPHFNLARVLLRLGLPAEAQRHLRRAAELDPRFASFLPDPVPISRSDGD